MEELQKELKNLEEAIDENIEATIQKLGEKSLEYIREQYSNKNLSKHISNTELNPYQESYKNGFIVSSGDDEIAVYNEYGTGIVGEGNPNPLASDSGYQYNIGLTRGKIPDGAKKEYGEKFCEEVTTPDTWWYHKNNKWWYTKGMEGKGMYSSLVEKLNSTAVKEMKAAISQTIGDYNKKV